MPGILTRPLACCRTGSQYIPEPLQLFTAMKTS